MCNFLSLHARLVALLALCSFTEACFLTTTRDGRVVAVGLTPGVVVYSRPPAPHPQAVWVEGHWQWNGRDHVWVDGYWDEYRPSHRYVAPHWEQQGNGWVYYEGYYEPVR